MESAPEETGGGNRWSRRLLVPGTIALVLLTGGLSYWWFSGVTDAAPDARPGDEGGAAHVEYSEAETPAAAWRIIEDFTKDVQDVAAAEGVPDGRSAVIAPGGVLGLAWTSGQFYNGEGPDVRVHGTVAAAVRYTIFARSGNSDPWVRFDINARGFPGGIAAHDLGHHGIEAARELLIRNEGGGDLGLDAVVPLYTAPQAHAEESHAHEEKR